MNKSKLRLLAFPFGDHEAVRCHLDQLAQKGWALTGRAGLCFGRFEPTQRKELTYDVVPAHPQRSPQLLREQVSRYDEAGWEPVDTIWGMDIYRSKPCRLPQPVRQPEDYRQRQQLYRNWLVWSAAFLAVTLLALWALCHFSGLEPATLMDRWYLNDRKTAIVLLLPALAVLALVWLVWLVWCLVCRTREHRPAPRWAMYLRGLLQLSAFGGGYLLLVLLWTAQVASLLLRLGLIGLFLLLPPAALLLFPAHRQRHLLTLGLGIILLFALSMALGWATEPLSHSTAGEGNGWRRAGEGLYLVTLEELEQEGLTAPLPHGETPSAYYRSQSSLLVSQSHYDEYWTEGSSIQLSVYRVHLPPLADLVWEDLRPEGADRQDGALFLDHGSWRHVWYRQGSTIYHLSGTLDWQASDLWSRAIAVARANGQS
ncbi:MAG: DUF2812 domain-containing protein [Oscillospiraceae bacterium]|nr:DUF2812 domain-containing protein [Oscillospiraceae bacterium]